MVSSMFRTMQAYRARAPHPSAPHTIARPADTHWGLRCQTMHERIHSNDRRTDGQRTDEENGASRLDLIYIINPHLPVVTLYLTSQLVA